MKYLVLVFSVIFLVSSCTTIEEQYTREGIRLEPEEQQEYYDHSPYYARYGPSIYNPIYWGGFYMGFPYSYWSPYSYYGFYDYYYGYYGGYYGGYHIYYRSRSGRSVITKKQLQKKHSSRVSTRSIQRNVGTIKSTGKTRSTGWTRSTVSRSGSATRSRATSSSRGTVKKKK